MTAPGGGTRLSAGSFDRPRASAVHVGRKFSNAVRPNERSYSEKKPLPRRTDEEAADVSGATEDYEQVTALHDCTFQ